MNNELSSESTSVEDESIEPRQSQNNGTNGAEKRSIYHLFRKYILRRNGEATLKSELEEIIQEHEDAGESVPEENIFIRNALKFGEIRVSQVMTPRPDIDAVTTDINLGDLKKFVVKCEHTRIPIYKENLDNVTGFLHIKDLMQYWSSGKDKDFKITDILRNIIYVPPSMKVLDLLEKMKAERTHVALVVDEYGGTDGLVTIEDLVEEIVGDIEDEHDEESQNEIVQIKKGVYEAEARIEIEKLEEQLNIKIYSEEREDFDTLGGLIFTNMGKVPEIGESLKHNSGLVFKIIDADNRRIKKVRITSVKN